MSFLNMPKVVGIFVLSQWGANLNYRRCLFPNLSISVVIDGPEVKRFVRLSIREPGLETKPPESVRNPENLGAQNVVFAGRKFARAVIQIAAESQGVRRVGVRETMGAGLERVGVAAVPVRESGQLRRATVTMCKCQKFTHPQCFPEEALWVHPYL